MLSVCLISKVQVGCDFNTPQQAEAQAAATFVQLNCSAEQLQGLLRSFLQEGVTLQEPNSLQ